MLKEVTTTSAADERLASSVERAAERIDLSKSYLRNEIRDGNLRAVRRGKRILILEDDLQAYLRGKSLAA